MNDFEQKKLEFEQKLREIGTPKILEISKTFFVQIITSQKLPNVNLLIRISQLFREVFNNEALLWVSELCHTEEDLFIERARLKYYDDSRVNGVSESTISEKDAFVKISTVDAKFLYFAGQYYYLKNDINIEFKQETEIPYSNFEINETFQYSALEIDGRCHTVCSKVKNNGSHFSVNVQPMPASDLAMG